MSNLLIAQSGGPTSAINASLSGVLSAFFNGREYEKIYGSRYGITGIFTGEILDLGDIFDSEDKIKRLKSSPSMFLGSCRCKLPDPGSSDLTEIAGVRLTAEEIYGKIMDFFHENEIKTFFYIGGNDSMDTVLKLSEYVRMKNEDISIIGIPKTIDNDLPKIDHTPGFGSAAKYIATSILEIAYDTSIYRIPSVTIVEIMGRDAGWLTAASALARRFQEAPDLIYLPEVPFYNAKFIEDVRNKLNKKRNVIVAVSEGIKNEDGKYLSENDSIKDRFGHGMLSGAGKYLESLVREELGVKVRSVEINILQRCAGHLTSKTDLDEAAILGETAYRAGLERKNGVMASLKRVPGKNYYIEYCTENIKGIANQVRNIPRSWINERGNDVKEEMLEYLRPLIIGENKIEFDEGLPHYQELIKNI